jgi:hypothetical protein
LDLKEHERVLVSVSKAAPSRSGLAVEFVERLKREQHDAEPALHVGCGYRAAYFFGTRTLDEIVNTPANVVRISRLTFAAMTSAFAIKARTQSVNPSVAIAGRQF